MSTVTNRAETKASTFADDTNVSSTTDADLLDAWVNDRHQDSLAILIQRYRIMVMSVCRRRCRSEDDADDAFQATFLHLAANAKSIRDPRRLPGWLHRVAQRAATATLKRSAPDTMAMVDTPADPDDPLDRLTQRHEAIVLDEELADLPEHYRTALVMHLLHGDSLGQLADQFGVTIGSIRGRLQRGKKLLASRLRRRGVVPVLTYAAAQACTATEECAASAGEALVISIRDTPGTDQLPNPPIEPSLLNPLLHQGTRLMPTLYTTGALVVGTGLLSLLMLTGNGSAQTRSTVEIPSSISTDTILHQAQFVAEAPEPTTKKKQQANSKQEINPTPTAATPELSKVALKVNEALDQPVGLPEQFNLAELPYLMSKLSEVPVLFDQRGLHFAGIDLANQMIEIRDAEVPLRTMLRTFLEPMGLKAVVDDEGLTITADTSVLVHRDIGASRWINIDEEAEQAISEKLSEKLSMEFFETPLNEVAQSLGERLAMPIYIDRRSLEDIGLTDDMPVTLEVENIGFANALELMLGELGLTYTIRGETLTIMSSEAADHTMPTRIYWLEGTGFSTGNADALIEGITHSVDVDIWEEVGGPATISTLDSGGSGRPAIVASTAYTTHRRIEKFIAALRETHFGDDPADVVDSNGVSQPKRNNRKSKSSFGGGGGGGGGFGGGGAF